MVSLKIFNAVAAELRRIEQKHGVRVLYACESGSRAWGFASRDSDYDVRFLYVHARDWYLSIDERRDVIEEPINEVLDISGWELRKALRLLQKSNPPLLEWLKSPVVYAQDDRFIEEFRELARDYYSPSNCFQHYLHMAIRQARIYLKEDMVRLKKHLYVLRPMLACRWIEQGLGKPPMLFDELVRRTVTEPEIREAIAGLVELKKAGDELNRSPRNDVLSEFIGCELDRLNTRRVPDKVPGDNEALNSFFRRHCLEEIPTR